MRNRAKRGTVLRDLTMGGRFGGVAPTPGSASGATPVGSEAGTGSVGGPSASPGVATAIARSVQQIPFDDSIDGTYPLECFFQMPAGVVRINDVQVWVQRKPFRRYVTASSSSASSGGGVASSSSGGGVTSSISATHAHAVFRSGPGGPTSTASGGTTDAQGVHTHLESGGGTTGAAGSHSHNLNFAHTHNDHDHATTGDGGHTHTTDTTHSHTTDTSHAHTITTTLTPGIYEEPLGGTVAVYVADDGVSYGAAVTSGVSEVLGLSIRSSLTTVKGNKRIRVNGTALMRVQVLLVMDLILELGV